tara:strand:- start:1536 stop:1922 length:387 start_codon:yes stop_codon:yes gene_type:complete
MEKYRGPKEQHVRMERKYFIQLFIGLFLILAAMPLETIRNTMAETEIEQPLGPGGNVEPPERIRTNTSPILAYVVIVGGTIINIRSMKKYRSDYAEIKEQYQRPEMAFLLIGIIFTTLAILISILRII